MLDHLHRQPRSPAIRAPLEHQIDLVLLRARIAQVVLSGFCERQQRAIGPGHSFKSGNAIRMIAIFAGNEDVRMGELPFRRHRMGSRGQTNQHNEPRTFHRNLRDRSPNEKTEWNRPRHCRCHREVKLFGFAAQMFLEILPVGKIKLASSFIWFSPVLLARKPGRIQTSANFRRIARPVAEVTVSQGWGLLRGGLRRPVPTLPRRRAIFVVP